MIAAFDWGGFGSFIEHLGIFFGMIVTAIVTLRNSKQGVRTRERVEELHEAVKNGHKEEMQAVEEVKDAVEHKEE